MAFSAVARVVLVAARVSDADGADKRILARSKSNIGPDDGGFEYSLAQGQLNAYPGVQASRIEWGKAVAGTARELLTDPDNAADDHIGDAAELLRAELAPDGWTNSDAASHPLKDAGFTKKQIWTASKKLNVIRKKAGMKGGWLWRLPGRQEDSIEAKKHEDSAEDSEGSSNLNRESSEPSGQLEPSEIEVL